jgi:hypothetical protein
MSLLLVLLASEIHKIRIEQMVSPIGRFRKEKMAAYNRLTLDARHVAKPLSSRYPIDQWGSLP